MQSFANAVTIGRAPEDVFAFLARFENIPLWNYAIEQTRQTSAGPVGTGTTYRQTRTVPRRAEEEFRVVAFEPVERLAIEGRIGPFDGRLAYELAPIDGGTRLTNTVSLRPVEIVARLAAPLAAARIKTAVAHNLDRLKQVLEGGGVT